MLEWQGGLYCVDEERVARDIVGRYFSDRMEIIGQREAMHVIVEEPTHPMTIVYVGYLCLESNSISYIALSCQLGRRIKSHT